MWLSCLQTTKASDIEYTTPLLNDLGHKQNSLDNLTNTSL